MGSGPSSLRERRHAQPPRLAKAVVTIATWQLPMEYRTRYRLEFYAELWEMGQVRKVTYAGALLLHSWNLSLALSDRDPEHVARPRSRRPLRCLLGMHSYVRRYTPDPAGTGSHFYMECRRCGKFVDIVRNPYGTFTP